MKAITIKNLESLVLTINKVTGSPQVPYTNLEGNYTPMPRNYHLDGAYGGWKLVRMLEGGGVQDVLQQGFMTKRELYEKLTVYLCGLGDAKLNQRSDK